VRAADADRLEEILGEAEVLRWWGEFDAERVRRELIEAEDEVVYAIEAGGELVGSVQYYEEAMPDYRHASLDIFVATEWQGQGLGSEALRLLAAYLFDERGHHPSPYRSRGRQRAGHSRLRAGRLPAGGRDAAVRARPGWKLA
jgi:aminoglycoside 6'-N-acetyltransferase